MGPDGEPQRSERGAWPRRRVLGFLTGAGGSVVFARAFVTLAAEAETG